MTEELIKQVSDIADNVDVLEGETTSMSREIDNLRDNMEYWVDDIRGDIKSCAQSIESIGQEQDDIKDELKDIREKLGEILTLLYESRK